MIVLETVNYNELKDKVIKIDNHSIKLNKIGYTFSGYFYTNTIANNLAIGSYIIITKEMAPVYELLNNVEFSQKKILVDGKKYTVVKRIK